MMVVADHSRSQDSGPSRDHDLLRTELIAHGRGLPLVPGGVELDELDQRLVELLSANGRASFRVMGDETGASEATIRKRVRRLLDEGIVQIVAIPALVDDQHALVASIRLSIAGRDPGQVAQEIAQWTETSWVATGAGPAAVLAELVGRDREQLWMAVSRLYALVGVTNVEPTILIKTYKQLYVGPTRAGLPPSGNDAKVP
jgi:Lrp/AsnC family transcriptional regulator for asnA, asnC and gidA